MPAWLRTDAMDRALAAPVRARRNVRDVVVLGAWVALVVSSHLALQRLIDAGRQIRIPFPPLDASLDWRPNWRLVFPIVLGAVAVMFTPRLARQWRWRNVLLGATVLSATWAVALAFVDGTHGLVGSVNLPTEYLGDVAKVTSPGAFLHGFVAHIAHYRVHVQGHPPGYLLVLWSLSRVGLANTAAVATLEIGVGALAIPAVLLAVREVAGESFARSAVPFVAVAPVAIWVATSADAFYAGVSVWAVALVVLATGRRDRRGDLLAAGGGVLFGITAFLSYGLVLLAIIPLAVAAQRRRWRPLALAVCGAAPVFLAFGAAGFWWTDGLLATRTRYYAGVASRRPYFEFLFANLASFAITLGPALAIALTRLRHRRAWVLIGGALAVVALADLTGMSKGEVERIWLPFALWVLPAAAVFALDETREVNDVGTSTWPMESWWLASQVAFAIGLQTAVRSPW